MLGESPCILQFVYLFIYSEPILLLLCTQRIVEGMQYSYHFINVIYYF